MAKQRRELTDLDYEKISELWRRNQALRQLRDHSLPSTAKGAWIRDAVELQMELIAQELEALFASTIAAEDETPPLES